MRLTTTTVVRRGEVLWRYAGDGVLVRRPGSDEYVELAGSAVALWDALAGAVSFSQLCADLAADEVGEIDTVRADVATLLEDLSDQGVIELD